MKTRVLYLATALLFSTGLFAQDTLPVIPKSPAWGLEVYAGGGVNSVADADFNYAATGVYPFSTGENFVVVAPGIRNYQRINNYREARGLIGGLELSRKIGLDVAIYTGLNFSYSALNAGGDFGETSVTFTAAPSDTIFFEPGNVVSSTPICEDEEFPDQATIDRSNRQNFRTGYLGVPVGILYNFPFLPIRLRGQISAHTAVYQRYFFRGLVSEFEDGCIRFVEREVDRELLFDARKITLRGAFGADVELTPNLHFGLQVEQQLNSSFRSERLIEGQSDLLGADAETMVTRTPFRPLYFSAVVRYSLR